MGSDDFLGLDDGEEESEVVGVNSSFVPDEETTVTCTFDESGHLFARDGETLKSQGTSTERSTRSNS